MTNQQFLDERVYGNQDPELQFRHLLVDGERITLDTFLEWNMLYADVDHISVEDAESIIALEIDESIFINLTEVKRIS